MVSLSLHAFCVFPSLLATELLTILKLYPCLVLEYADELIEFVHRMKSLDNGFEEFFTNVVSLDD